jgi:hypothetical protein
VADVIFVLALVAFFALCALYVRGCERIIRAGENGGEAGQTADDFEREVAR